MVTIEIITLAIPELGMKQTALSEGIISITHRYMPVTIETITVTVPEF
jgi:hypothetical protein